MIKFIKKISFFTSINVGSIYLYIQYKSKSKSKINIIFDLDETIIHTETKNRYNDYNKKNISKPNINIETILLETNRERIIWIRPFVKLLLPIICKYNNIYLFTKAQKKYTDMVLEKTELDRYFKEKKYRDECNNTCKDLSKFNIDLEKSILIDDKLSNRCDTQNFYHIPRYNCYVKNDFEFINIFFYVLWLNIKYDLLHM